MPEQETWIGEGNRRPVGVEVEFGRLDAVQAAAAVRRRFGGTLRASSAHRLYVEDTELGTFKVELDWDWVHDAYDDGGIVDKTKALLGDIGREVVPTEVVTPPVPAGRLPEIDGLVGELARLGAEGTRSGLLYGFGLHLNPALGPGDLAAEPIRRVLQAYLLEAPALRAAIDVDPMRVLLPFVEPFPRPYLDLVLDPDYQPSLVGLIDDYLRFNATRNRELDLLPLFAEIDRERVATAVPDPKISARPTFHWRLPNADIEDPAWTVTGQWARWLAVETVALDRDGLTERLAARHRRTLQREGLWASLF
jgi:hypothetical protein